MLTRWRVEAKVEGTKEKLDDEEQQQQKGYEFATTAENKYINEIRNL